MTPASPTRLSLYEQLTCAVLSGQQGEGLVALAKRCDEGRVPWRLWLLEHLLELDVDSGRRRLLLQDLGDLMADGPARSVGAEADKQTLKLSEARVQALHMALLRSNQGGPDEAMLILLARTGHPLGMNTATRKACIKCLAENQWVPPEALAEGLFEGEAGKTALNAFFQDLLRSYDNEHFVDTDHLTRLEAAGVMGQDKDAIRTAACKAVAECTQDFRNWEAMEDRYQFPEAVQWMVEHEWVDAAGVTAAADTILSAHRQREIEAGLFDMLERMGAQHATSKMEQSTAAARRHEPRSRL